MLQSKTKSELVSNFSLDKLAQLRKSPLDHLQKRARSKVAQSKLVYELRNLKSDLNKSYINTFFCSHRLIRNGKELIARFCGNRWCLICNRIRTAKLIKGYLQPLNELPDLQFVTLTIKNVKRDQLHFKIRRMFNELKNIQEVMRKRKLPLTGIKKIECTYNQKSNDYHPHFHCVISGLQPAQELIKEWLYRNNKGLEHIVDEVAKALLKHPNSKKYIWLGDDIESRRKLLNVDPQWQDVRQADEQSLKELFKYFTKLLSKDERSFNPFALDVMFKAMKGIRVFQSIGKLKKLIVSEEIEDIHAVEYDNVKNEFNEFYDWGKIDWINLETGELLTNYQPSESIIKLQESINQNHNEKTN